MTWELLDLRLVAEISATTTKPTAAGLYPGARHLLIGEPGVGKSLFGCAVGLEEIRAFGRVVAVDLETTREQRLQLLRDLGATDEDLASWRHVEPDGPPSEDDLAAILAFGATLVLIDAGAGAYSVSGLDDNARADVESFNRRWVGPIHSAGVTSVVVDHVAKAVESRGRWPIGSERKLGAVDVALALAAKEPLRRGGRGVVEILPVKDRFGYLDRTIELHLQSDPESHRITWSFTSTDVDEPAVEKALGWIADFVAADPGQPRSAVEAAFAKHHGRGGRALARRAVDEGLARGERGEGPGQLAKTLGEAPNGVYLVLAEQTRSPLAEGSPGELGEPGSPDAAAAPARQLAAPFGGQASGERCASEPSWVGIDDEDERLAAIVAEGV
jgi:hypothetical protein